MEIKEKMSQLASRIADLKDSVSTEEATKTSLVLPFFSMLGYDIFNPLEFVPEFTADVAGVKKKEKVDYAIMFDGEPLILIECKASTEKLDKHDAQLFRYYSATPAKFGILTNGVVYRFYTDTEKENVMDLKPFLTINMLNLKDRDFAELNKFVKGNINVDDILHSANDLKYTSMIKEWLAGEIAEPSPAFVRFVISDIYEGVKNQRVVDKFTPLVRRALTQYINDSMNEKIQNALNKENSEETTAPEAPEAPAPEAKEDTTPESKIETTLEELEAYAVVKTILRKTVPSSRVFYRDGMTYFGILLDDNNRKWLCRFFVLSSKKYIQIPDENRIAVRYDIETVDDIYNYEAEIIRACQLYL